MSDEYVIPIARRAKRCAICGAQATHRCLQCNLLYCTAHADCCSHRGALHGGGDKARAIREATCGICGRVVTNESGDRYVGLDACRSCGALVCDLCVGHVEVRQGPHLFSVHVWCEDCAPARKAIDPYEELRVLFGSRS